MNKLVKSRGIPVLVVGFNRSTSIIRVLTALQGQEISKLYIWLDGPRVSNPLDTSEQKLIKKFLAEKKFDCPSEVIFNPENLGCGRSVSGAISWFFSNEESGAILEDDCLPSPDFVPFMSEQLQRWRADNGVMTVSGNAILGDWTSEDSSYHFSKYPHVWGWGSWRRVWEEYDLSIAGWSERRRTDWLKAGVGLDPYAERFWRHKFNQIRRGTVDTWDYQLTFLSFLKSGKNVITHKNLVENIGFGSGATHTTKRPLGLVSGFDALGPFKHPSNLEIDAALDHRLEREIHRTKRNLMELTSLAIKNVIRRLSASRESRD